MRFWGEEFSVGRDFFVFFGNVKIVEDGWAWVGLWEGLEKFGGLGGFGEC